MPIKPEHLHELLAGYEKPEDLLGEGSLFRQLKKTLLERALGADLTSHLGHEPGQPAAGECAQWQLPEDGDHRRGTAADRRAARPGQQRRAGDRPQGATRIEGFDDKIIGMYARGMCVRDIKTHLRELYGVDVSPDQISRVTDAMLDEIKEWQNRSLERVYPILFLDALRVRIRDEGMVRNKPSTLPWPSTARATRKSWGCGSSRPKALSSGCG